MCRDGRTRRLDPRRCRLRGGRLSLRSVGTALQVSLQRLGGPARRRFGVPPRGPIDPTSHRLALALAGLSPDASAYELFLPSVLTGELEVDSMVSVVGCDTQVTIDARALEENRSFWLRAGTTMQVKVLARGTAYVAIQPGCRLAEVRLAERSPSLAIGPIRILAGPQWSSELDLTSREFGVGPLADRMGLRLGPDVRPHQISIASEPTTVGAVQWTPSGELIVLGPDGPTLGGYPKPAVLARADLTRLGQLGLRPFEFEWINRDQAAEMRQQAEANLAALLRAISYRVR